MNKILSIARKFAAKCARIITSPLRPKPHMSVSDALDKLTRRVYGNTFSYEDGRDTKRDCLIAWHNARITSANAAARFNSIDPTTATVQTVDSAFAEMRRARDDEREKLARVLLSSFSIHPDTSLTLAIAHLHEEMTTIKIAAPAQRAAPNPAANGAAKGC